MLIPDTPVDEAVGRSTEADEREFLTVRIRPRSDGAPLSSSVRSNTSSVGPISDSINKISGLHR